MYTVIPQGYTTQTSIYYKLPRKSLKQKGCECSTYLHSFTTRDHDNNTENATEDLLP